MEELRSGLRGCPSNFIHAHRGEHTKRPTWTLISAIPGLEVKKRSNYNFWSVVFSSTKKKKRRRKSRNTTDTLFPFTKANPE